jgi:hypothetical protein
VVVDVGVTSITPPGFTCTVAGGLIIGPPGFTSDVEV